jgi:hypothetical protein
VVVVTAPVVVVEWPEFELVVPCEAVDVVVEDAELDGELEHAAVARATTTTPTRIDQRPGIRQEVTPEA